MSAIKEQSIEPGLEDSEQAMLGDLQEMLNWFRKQPPNSWDDLPQQARDDVIERMDAISNNVRQLSDHTQEP